jgi:hypothetical protein
MMTAMNSKSSERLYNSGELSEQGGHFPDFRRLISKSLDASLEAFNNSPTGTLDGPELKGQQPSGQNTGKV